MEKIKKIFYNLDKKILEIMKKGISFCFGILIVSILILSFNLLFVHKIFLFNLGLYIFKISIYFSIEFIICGFVVNKIKNT